MGLVNVRRDIKDTFYRYKMEELQTKVEGKGNGIKTVIVNLPSIAASLARPSSHVIKYFGFELGAPTKFYPQGERWIINGAHQAKTLQDLLDGFIDKFVLCKMCKNPETDVVLKDGRIILDCKACGQRSNVDLSLKLSGFILKETPKKNKKDKAERRAAKKAKQNGENGHGSGDEDSENNDNDANGNGSGNGNADVGSDDEFEKVQLEATNAAAVNNDVVVKDDEWAVDMSAEAVKARQAQLPGEFKQKLNIGGDDDEDGEGGGNTIYDELGDWIDEQAEEKGGVDNIASIDVYVKAKALGIEGKHRTVLVLVQTLFNENICSQIPKRASVLKQIVTSERHQKALLGGTERLLGSLLKDHPEILKQVVKILQLYYHHDLISEEFVIPWGKKASKKYTDLSTSRKVRKAAEPFLQWLEEAEEDSEESDEE
ncbi:Eukaryotic translation initiation factor 5 [Escovopsis weberi]|uniref:Eukaryotic translation initiation factor 5 n=1 Tax=Escovopsis weberi TaxID=150374 RepID=A0A0M9VUD4_ESCWE|nr:Eukaryotic translation initiation factor 5 [Escovopsis weberi]